VHDVEPRAESEEERKTKDQHHCPDHDAAHNRHSPPSDGWEDRIGGFTNIAFVAVQRTYDVLSAKGVEFSMPLKTEHWGTAAIFKDADGNQFVLSSVACASFPRDNDEAPSFPPPGTPVKRRPPLGALVRLRQRANVTEHAPVDARNERVGE
jgi:hypothetical protein